MNTSPTNLPSRRGTEESLSKLVLELLAFAAMIAFFLFLMIKEWNWIPGKDKVPTTAVVTEIDSYMSGRIIKYDVYIRYQVEGLELESKMDDYFFRMKAGDRIKIFYDQNHPFKAQLNGVSKNMTIELVAISIFGMFFVLDLRKAIEVVKGSRRKKRPDSPE